MSDLNRNLVRIMWEQCYALSKQIDKYKINTYPNQETTEVIDHISVINNNLLDIFSQHQDEIINNRELKLYKQILDPFQRVIVKIVDQSNTTNHPLEVMIPVREIVNRIDGDIKNFITEPSWELNYAIGDFWSVFARFINKLGVSDVDEEKRIRVIFPILHKDNVLLGSIMGHELGHYLDLHHGLNISEQLMPKILKHQDISKLEPFLHGEIIDKLPQPIRIAVIKSVLSNAFLIDWLKEFVADISGIVLYGPASHFSCEQIFMFYGISDGSTLADRFSQTHPRKIIRSIVRRETMSHFSYENHLPEKIQEIIDSLHNGWKNASHNDIYSVFTDTIMNNNRIEFVFNNDSCKIIEDILMDNLDLIIDKVVKSIPEEVHYTSEKIDEWVNPLADKLSKLTPPNELNRVPADSVSILNAGWFAYYLFGDSIKEERGLSALEGELELRNIINNLTRKALVSADVHRRWSNVGSLGETN
ncbi:hypothetical protein MUN89_00915 [Halobacillus salinarum]|uniref:Uncharacterized protein n=1 Tax=Halobacillus salinarum TaxID=2932257 RepID=A0ABY4EJB7_9BACI|nr:hypothetical protein [Halobacillus salinarum]UOQ44573.1 hypothetical protein MUN89_00915 [Halobacillus salinarum]